MPDVTQLLGNISSLDLLSLALMVAAGLLVGVAPSSYPLLAVATGFAAGGATDGAGRWRRGLVLSAGFVAGVALVDAVIGGLFGLFGFLVLRLLADVMFLAYLGLGALLVLLALALMRVVRVNLRLLYPTPRPARSFGSAVALGIPFGLSTCPACTPVILPVLLAAAGTGDPWMGGTLLLVFGLGRGIPIMVTGTAASALGRLQGAMFWVPRIERIGGALLLVASLWFFYRGGVYAGWWPPLGAT